MANRLEVSIDVTREEAASASFANVARSAEAATAAVNAGAAELSPAAAAIERDLLKMGVGAEVARKAAQQFAATTVEASATAVKAYEREAVAAELSAKQQLAAAASLQRQRSSALIQQAREEERAALRAAEGAPISAFGLRRAITTGAQAAGLPGEVGALGGLGAFGGPIALIGGALAAVAAVRELITLDAEAQKSQIDLALAARDTGQSFGELSADAETFRASIIGTREDANTLAGALGDLQARTGNVFNSQDLAQSLSTITTARGLDAKDAAKLIEGVGRGDKGAFEALTNRSAELALDAYARSVGTTTARLTQMQRAQALVSAAMQESAKYTDLAAARVDSLDGRLSKFKSDVTDALSQGGVPYLLGLLASGGDPTKAAGIGLQLSVQRAVEGVGAGAKASAGGSVTTDAQDAARQEARRAQLEEGLRRFQEQNFGAGTEGVQARLAAARELQARFESVKASISTDDAERFGHQIAESLKSANHQLDEMIDHARDQVPAALTTLAARLDRDNPFVKLGLEGEQRISALRKQFAPLGDDFVEQMVRMERAATAVDAATLRFNSRLTALRDHQEAERLRQPFVGLTGAEERSSATAAARGNFALSGVAGREQANALRAGFARVDPNFLATQQFNELLRQEREMSGLTGGAAKAAKAEFDKRFEQIYNSLSPDQQARVARDPSLAVSNRRFQSAFAGDAARSQKEIADSIERERAGNQLQANAREQLQLFNQSGLPTDEKLKQFLAITGTLSDKELTGDLRIARARALDESARREAGREGAADNLVKALTAIITGKGLKIDGDIGLNFNVKDDLTVAPDLGSTPKPEASDGQ